jgi:hypothetical protein
LLPRVRRRHWAASVGQAVRRDCSFAKKQESGPALVLVVI